MLNKCIVDFVAKYSVLGCGSLNLREGEHVVGFIVAHVEFEAVVGVVPNCIAISFDQLLVGQLPVVQEKLASLLHFPHVDNSYVSFRVGRVFFILAAIGISLMAYFRHLPAHNQFQFFLGVVGHKLKVAAVLGGVVVDIVHAW
jgi:hypothetical protein